MKQTKHRTATLVRDYLVIFVIGVILLYPIIWMFFASFKSNDEIFGSICLLPQNFSFKYFIEGWKGSGKVTYTTFTGHSHYHIYSYVQCPGCLWLCKISVSGKEDPFCTAHCHADAAKFCCYHSSLYFIQ